MDPYSGVGVVHSLVTGEGVIACFDEMNTIPLVIGKVVVCPVIFQGVVARGRDGDPGRFLCTESPIS